MNTDETITIYDVAREAGVSNGDCVSCGKWK